MDGETVAQVRTTVDQVPRETERAMLEHVPRVAQVRATEEWVPREATPQTEAVRVRRKNPSHDPWQRPLSDTVEVMMMMVMIPT